MHCTERLTEIDDQVSKLRRELRDYELEALSNDDENTTTDLEQIELLELEILSLNNERTELNADCNCS